MDKTMKITGKGKISVKPDRIRLNMLWKNPIRNMK